MGSEIINNEKMEAMRRQLDLRRRQAKREQIQKQIDAKQQVVVEYQNGRLTAEEYQELLGETFGETLKEMFEHQVFLARSTVAVRVGKTITPEDFEAITGVPYVEEDYM